MLHPVVTRAPNRSPARPLRRIVLRDSNKFIEGHESFGDEEGLLFDLASDPQELDNLRATDPERARELAERAKRYAAGLERREPVHQVTGQPLSSSDGAGVDLSDEELEELRAFGYLGGGEDE